MHKHLISINLATLIQLPALQFLLDLEPSFYRYAFILLFMTFFIPYKAPKVNIDRGLLFYLIMILSLFVMLLTSIIWTISVDAWKKQALSLTYIIVLLIVVSQLVSPKTIGLFFRYLTFYAVCISSYALWAGDALTWRLISGFDNDLFGSSYGVVAHSLALGFITSVAHVCGAPNHRLLWLGISIVLSIGIGLTGHRGSLIFPGLIVLGFGFLTFRFQTFDKLLIRPELMRRYLLLIIPLCGLMMWGALRVERTHARLMRMVDVVRELEEGGRGSLMTNAWHHIREKPLIGYGLGSHGLKSGSREDTHPHNMFLQIWLDAGIAAVILLAIIIVWPLMKAISVLRSNPPDHILLSVTGIYVFLVLQYSKSGDFYLSRELFLIGLLLLVTFTARVPDSYGHSRIAHYPYRISIKRSISILEPHDTSKKTYSKKSDINAYPNNFQ
jgi:O-antigen ligase